jgi:hypothetical protein
VVFVNVLRAIVYSVRIRKEEKGIILAVGQAENKRKGRKKVTILNAPTCKE